MRSARNWAAARIEPLAVIAGLALVAAGVAAFDPRLGLIAAGLALVASTIDFRRIR